VLLVVLLASDSYRTSRVDAVRLDVTDEMDSIGDFTGDDGGNDVES